jgi:hypothetical protein
VNHAAELAMIDRMEHGMTVPGEAPEAAQLAIETRRREQGATHAQSPVGQL